MKRGNVFFGLIPIAAICGCTPVYCADTCRHAFDGECDDGRPGATTGLCALGTDCSDCGANPNAEAPMGVTRPVTIPAPGPPVSGTLPPTSGSGYCVCPADFYCRLDEDLQPIEGGGGVTACSDHVDPANPPPPGGVATPCHTASMACRGWNDSRLEYECRDGEHGVGCYAIRNEYCEDVGTCPEGSRNEGMTIEHCVHAAEFEGHFNSPYEQMNDPFEFDPEGCHSWYRVGTAEASCGACSAPCNVLLTGGPNPCEMEQGPGAGDFDCGDGTFIPASQVCNRASDCANGRDERSSTCGDESNCCTATRGCPGETGSSCGSSCCCCPGGQRCCSDWSRGCCPA